MNIPCLLSSILPGKVSLSLYKMAGLKDKSISFSSRIHIDKPAQVSIGKGSLINHGCDFYIGENNTTTITLGQNVYVAPNVAFVCVSHEIGSSNKRAGKNTYKSISVGNGVWIGTSATILQGVTIGDGSIICAGAIVTKDVPQNCMYGGVPAKFIKHL